MDPATDDVPFRRVLVILDATTELAPVLQRSVEFAAGWGTAVTSLFVEDLDLLNTAALPFVQQISPSTADREFELGATERQLRALAARARRLLAAEAKRLEVTWTFSVVRGRRDAEIVAACLEADLLVVHLEGRPLTRHSRLAPSPQLRELGVSVLLLGPGARPPRAVRVILEDDPSAGRLLRAAVGLALRHRLMLEVVPPTNGDPAGLQRALKEMLRTTQLQAEILPAGDWVAPGPSLIRDRLLVLRSRSALVDELTRRRLECAVLLIH